MKGFDAIELDWGGETYAVPADRQLELIMRIEDGLIAGKDRQAFQVLVQRSGPPVALIGKVYADALAYAGATVPAVDVVRGLQDAIRCGDGAIYAQVADKLSEILGVIEAPADDHKEKSPGKAKGSGEAS
jgi:hypothetical protein